MLTSETQRRSTDAPLRRFEELSTQDLVFQSSMLPRRSFTILESFQVALAAVGGAAQVDLDPPGVAAAVL